MWLLLALGACSGAPDSTGKPDAADVDRDGVSAARDCDDADATVHPGATEQCNSQDDDCDELVDDADPSLDRATTSPWYPDADGDTYGDPRSPVSACAAPPGYADDSLDCDDTDREICPGAAERCDGVDNDCHGGVDDGLGSDWFEDADGDGYGNPVHPVHSCTTPAGYVPDRTDCRDDDPEAHPGAPERCNAQDDDCDGAVNDGLPTKTWYLDLDRDGYGAPGWHVEACEAPPWYVAPPGDCNDANPMVNPGRTEECNTIDDDCDGRVNDGLVNRRWYRDVDGDGYGNDALHTGGCAEPAGYTSQRSDCDDTNRAIHPDASEVCNHRDDNCDGQIDERTVEPIWFYDHDRDGFGSSTRFSTTCDRPSPAYTHDASDCDDGNASVNPDAAEVCNGMDRNCDGLVDDDDPTAISWADADADGSGDPSTPLVGCPAGSASNAGDCDDTDPTSHSFATEVCDDVDNDCDGTLDDVATEDKTVWYPDADGDGLGAYDGLTRSCTAPSADAVLTGGDCDDTDPAVGSCAVSGRCTGDVVLTYLYVYYWRGYEMSRTSAGCVGGVTFTVDAATGAMTGALSCGLGLSGGEFASATIDGTTDGAHATGTITDGSSELDWAGDFSVDGTLTLAAAEYESNYGWGTNYWASWTLTGDCSF